MVHDASTNHESSLTLRSMLNSIAAGYCSGVAGTIVGHPFDSIKVRLQAGNQLSYSTSNQNHCPPSTATAQSAGNAMIRTGSYIPLHKTLSRPMSTSTSIANSVTQSPSLGCASASSRMFFNRIRSLYVGVQGPLLTVGIVQSIYFGVYDSCRSVLYKYTRPEKYEEINESMQYLNSDCLLNVGVSSMVAGAIISIVTNPLALVKTRQQTASTFNPNIRFRDVLHQIYRSNANNVTTGRHFFQKSAIPNFYKGFTPHFVSEIIGRSAYLVTYEFMKRTFINNRTKSNCAASQCTLPERMFSAAIAGMFSWMIIFPLDAVRTRMYAQADPQSSMTTRQMMMQMYCNGGLGSFYRGFFITIVRAGPIAAFALPMYDISLEQIAQL